MQVWNDVATIVTMYCWNIDGCLCIFCWWCSHGRGQREEGARDTGLGTCSSVSLCSLMQCALHYITSDAMCILVTRNRRSSSRSRWWSCPPRTFRHGSAGSLLNHPIPLPILYVTFFLINRNWREPRWRSEFLSIFSAGAWKKAPRTSCSSPSGRRTSPA